MKKLMGYDIEDLLELAGLERRRSTLGMLLPAASFAMGAMIGAGLGLALAPSSGRRLRQDVSGRIEHMREHAKNESRHCSEANANSSQG